MTVLLRLAVAAAIGLTGCGGAAPSPVAAAAPASTPVSAGGFVDLGRVLTATDFGRPGGSIDT